MSASIQSDAGRPVIVVGAPRSGTTMVAESLLASHPEVAYWGEPSFIWRYGNAYRFSDILTSSDAKPFIADYIRQRFRQRLESAGKRRLVEKTPSNSLRMEFVLRVFPNAQVIHVIRDGRDVALSAAVEWRGGGGQALDYRHLREGGTIVRIVRGLRMWARLGERVADARSLFELPSIAGRVIGFIARRLINGGFVPWGPRVPGLWRFRLSHSLIETCAVQWQACVTRVKADCSSLGPNQFLEVRYEDLVGSPREETRRILQFIGLEASHGLVEDLAARVVRRPLPLWPLRMARAERMLVERLIAGTLERLSYSQAATEAAKSERSRVSPADRLCDSTEGR